MKFNLLPIWAQIAIVAVALGSIFGAGWKVNGWRLQGKISNLKTDVSKYEKLAEGWESEHERCSENETKLKTALDEVAAKAVEISALKNQLVGAERATHTIAVELAQARSERAVIEDEYDALEAASVNQSVCQTYGSVLAALAGEGP